jgi:hypothetical protein
VVHESFTSFSYWLSLNACVEAAVCRRTERLPFYGTATALVPSSHTPYPLWSGPPPLAAGTRDPDPASFCFTSADSNWSNNPIIFPRAWFNEKLRDLTLNTPEIWRSNEQFEFRVMLDVRAAEACGG